MLGADSGAPKDFVEGNLKFHRSSAGFIQVVDIAKNESAGTVIFPPGGAPMFAPMPGYDIKSAYEKHMSTVGGTTASSTAKEDANRATFGQSSPATPAPGVDAASKTVTLADARVVTFVDDKHAEVKLPGPAGTQTYELEYHKGGTGGLFKTWADSQQGRIGGSMRGSGVTISLASANGMPGGQLYDTARGTNVTSGIDRIKPIIAAVREAVDTVKTTEPKLAQSTVIKSLLSNNLGI